MLGQIYGFGDGGQVGNAADVDAGHHGADFGEIDATDIRCCRLSPEDEESCNGDGQHAEQSDEKGFHGHARRESLVVAAYQHEGNGEQHYCA